MKMAGLPALNEDQMKLVQDLEIEMMSDMYTRMTNSCHKKCVAKYWEIHERVGKKLQKMSTQDEEALKKIAAEQGLVK
ncbi:Mitochondrial import inner membrane translocase subunit Tim10-like [Homarus americanus]|uniref:Mitochondrial import inner membrane translocase subunit n=1 Tax=Homarus americanus TaxID=6706 RepID=A0A8J5KAJ1_HOMAM|nr:Mitochondrial import inner membrane translocase subunit Tim10-like [Homarus americanus]